MKTLCFRSIIDQHFRQRQLFFQAFACSDTVGQLTSWWFEDVISSCFMYSNLSSMVVGVWLFTCILFSLSGWTSSASWRPGQTVSRASTSTQLNHGCWPVFIMAAYASGTMKHRLVQDTRQSKCHHVHVFVCIFWVIICVFRRWWRLLRSVICLCEPPNLWPEKTGSSLEQ